MDILKFISNLFYDKGTYFGSRCSGYGCYPSFDEILEANRDVLERIKEKGD